jgi:hypothetical protein
MEYTVPEEPFISLGNPVKEDDSNVPSGRLADTYNREDAKVFFKPVYREENLINDGYSIAADVLDKLRLHRARTVFILERDTDLVLEFDLEQFRHPISDSDFYVAKESEAEYRWPDLGFDLFSNDTLWGK